MRRFRRPQAWRPGRVEPRAYLAGVVLGFVCASLVGGWLAGRDVYSGVTRFHYWLSPETFFWPTAAGIRRLALARVPRDRILVLVSGDSVLQGVGQPASRMWPTELQRELGERYGVVNIAMRAGHLGGGATAVAEVLREDFPRLVLVTGGHALRWWTQPDGGVVYRRIFWDAWARGWLAAFPERKAFLDRYAATAEDGETVRENQRGARLNAWFHFDDLWGYVAYRHLYTVWHPAAGLASWKPRAMFQDEEQERPGLDAGLLWPGLATAHARLHRRHLAGMFTDGPDGSPVAAAEAWDRIERTLQVEIPPVLRRQTLVVLTHTCPCLDSAVNELVGIRYTLFLREVERIWASAGVSSLRVGADFEAADFIDGGHMTVTGGRKFARAVAPAVREMAERLKYLEGPRD